MVQLSNVSLYSLSENKIIDLSNTGNASQKDAIADFEQLADKVDLETLPRLHEEVLKCIDKIFTKVSFTAKKNKRPDVSILQNDYKYRDVDQLNKNI